ncbi:MAG: IMPACT family protein, partial [Bacteroidota bacterium]
MARLRTIQQPGKSLYKSSGSKHFGFSYYVSTEADVKGLINELWELFPDATHVCYAFILSVGIEKSSDDGEPSGSAGKPILNVLKSERVKNVLVAVVRYYGGTNLGIPGLIDAYKSAAKLAIENSGVHEISMKKVLTFEVPYSSQPLFMNKLNRLNYSKNYIE